MMMNLLRFRYALTLAGTAALLFAACEVEEQGSLFNPSYTTLPQPVITAVSPAGSAQAGVDTLTITGSNFSATADYNIVYFDATPGTIVQAGATQLRVKAPLVIGDSIKLRVAVRGAELMSEITLYKLDAAVLAAGSLAPTEGASGITADASGNLYVSIQEGAADLGIFKYIADGSRTRYAPPTSGVLKWSSLKMGPGGEIYAARNFRALYKYAAGGGTAAAVWVTFPVGVFAADMDFDQNQNLWVGGNNSNLYRVKQDKTIKTFPFVGNVRSVRVYNGSLYVAAQVDTLNKIYVAPIIGDSLGALSVYFDFSAVYPGSTVTPNALTFSSDGYLYIGTVSPNGLVVVAPGGSSSSVPFVAYTSLFSPAVRIFAWGSGDALYATTDAAKLLKISTRKTSAPYYGL